MSAEPHRRKNWKFRGRKIDSGRPTSRVSTCKCGGVKSRPLNDGPTRFFADHTVGEGTPNEIAAGRDFIGVQTAGNKTCSSYKKADPIKSEFSLTPAGIRIPFLLNRPQKAKLARTYALASPSVVKASKI
jgi:hypothetical protein